MESVFVGYNTMHFTNRKQRGSSEFKVLTCQCDKIIISKLPLLLLRKGYVSRMSDGWLVGWITQKVLDGKLVNEWGKNIFKNKTLTPVHNPAR